MDQHDLASSETKRYFMALCLSGYRFCDIGADVALRFTAPLIALFSHPLLRVAKGPVYS